MFLSLFRNFIENNLRTVENPYFKRAVEGKLESGYNYTFSIPIGDDGKTEVFLVSKDITLSLYQ